MEKLYQLIQKNLSAYAVSANSSKSRVSKKIILPVITISREKGSGGRIIANLLAEKLGKQWKVYGKEIIDEISKVSHLGNALVKEIDERNIPLIEQVVADFFGQKYFNLTTYYKSLVTVLSAINQRGYAIIIGRGANFLLPQSLKIRTICEMRQRILWEMQYEKYSEERAKAIIMHSDEERMNFVKSLYHHDQRKAHHYDMVIRTGPSMSVIDAADIIAKAAKKRFRL